MWDVTSLAMPPEQLGGHSEDAPPQGRATVPTSLLAAQGWPSLRQVFRSRPQTWVRSQTSREDLFPK